MHDCEHACAQPSPQDSQVCVSVSISFHMTLDSSTAIHGHCQVQYISLCVSTVGHDAAGVEKVVRGEK